jgi:hypothetical protein
MSHHVSMILLGVSPSNVISSSGIQCQSNPIQVPVTNSVMDSMPEANWPKARDQSLKGFQGLHPRPILTDIVIGRSPRIFHVNAYGLVESPLGPRLIHLILAVSVASIVLSTAS